MNSEINIRHLAFFIVACLLVFLPGLCVDVMNVDAAQYASISSDMLKSSNWLEIHNKGMDYLDKPPLLFWLSASCFKLFGISNWAYKLPSFLFAILGVFSTAKLGEILYDKKTGMLAALLLVFSLGMFIMTNDIRTDTLLLGSTVFAAWQLLLYLKTNQWVNLILGFIGIGLAMLAKGPLGLVLPVVALSSEFAYKREWKSFFKWQWLVGLIIIAILLLPMSYGLYQQFDLHPENEINGHTHVSGLRFYFWTQSFGRITGESDWGTKFDNGAGPFFFTHTYLWVFFPWSLLLIGALIKNFFVLIKSRFKPGYLVEVFSTGGFVLMFIALSASRYKLPHYVYVLLPFSALIVARFILQDVLDPARKGLFRIFSVFHWVFFGAIFLVCTLFLFVFFPNASILTICAAYCLLFLGILFAWKFKNPFTRLIYPLLFGLLALYFVGDSHFYPQLLKYQNGNVVGRIVVEKKIPSQDFYALNVSDHALDFYCGHMVPTLSQSDTLIMDKAIRENGKLWLYTDEEGAAQIHSSKYHIISENKFEDYHVQFLTINFLLPEKRNGSLRYKYLMEIAI
ncbi:MAG: glycosyltransferase family 39 protein [Bacteroidetes bacterium]|nr:glycosyltransferase family 39 protein [Bacteroidota bacterium]